MNNNDNNLFPFLFIAGSMVVIGICGATYGIVQGILSLFS